MAKKKAIKKRRYNLPPTVNFHDGQVIPANFAPTTAATMQLVPMPLPRWMLISESDSKDRVIWRCKSCPFVAANWSRV